MDRMVLGDKQRHTMKVRLYKGMYITYSGMGNFSINPSFRIVNFHLKHEISLLHMFTRSSFCVKSSYLGLYIRKGASNEYPQHFFIEK